MTGKLKNPLAAAILLVLDGLNDIELATLGNVSGSGFQPNENHHGYNKWISIFSTGRTTLDPEIQQLIQNECANRL